MLQNRCLQVQFTLNNQTIQNFCFPGSKVSRARVVGVSVLLGSMTFWPHVAYAMDGLDLSVDDDYADSLGGSSPEKDVSILLPFARKIWLPVVFVVTVLLNLGHPVALATKAFLFLLSTKPSPLSVYIYVEQLCHQAMRQEQYFYRLKSLYANKVEVEDYKLICLARVELINQKFTLVGVLGSWWALPSLPSKEILTGVFRKVHSGMRKQSSMLKSPWLSF